MGVDDATTMVLVVAVDPGLRPDSVAPMIPVDTRTATV